MSPSHRTDLIAVVRRMLHHVSTKYDRSRLLGPRQSLLLLLTMINSEMNRIGIRPAKIKLLSELTGACGWRADVMPSVSAICRALRTLTPDMLESVIQCGLADLNRSVMPSWLAHRRRLVTIDGVRVNSRRTSILARWLNLPEQADEKKAHQPQALVVTARCVATGVTLAQEIVKHNGSERAVTRRLIERLAQMGPMLVLMDRGIPARDIIAAMQAYKHDFIVRMCGGKSAWRELAGWTDGPKRDQHVTIKSCTFKGTTAAHTLRAIITRRVGPGRPRCNRSAQRMLLLTNLTGKYWNTDRIIAAYHRRWDIETQFREDKRMLGATKSHATTKNGFTTELLALQIYRIIMAIAGLISATNTVIHLDDPYARRNSTPQIIAMAWAIVTRLLMRRIHIDELMELIVHEIARDAASRRPARTFKRKCRGVEGHWKNKAERSIR